MAVKLKTNTRPKAIPVCELKDGQIAEIIAWGCPTSTYTGTIIQRFNTDIIVIGKAFGTHWDTVLKSANADNYLVRVLEEGEALVITNN
jgi:hypothetical protein